MRTSKSPLRYFFNPDKIFKIWLRQCQIDRKRSSYDKYHDDPINPSATWRKLSTKSLYPIPKKPHTESRCHIVSNHMFRNEFRIAYSSHGHTLSMLRTLLSVKMRLKTRKPSRLLKYILTFKAILNKSWFFQGYIHIIRILRAFSLDIPVRDFQGSYRMPNFAINCKY